jgi:hypothetical protein
VNAEARESDDWIWVASNGGPLLLVPEEFVDAWLGIDPPPDGRVIRTRFRWNESSPPCDYDRACDINDYLGEISVGRGSAVVLGDEPLPTVWRPSPNAEGGVLVRCRYVESEADEQRLLESIPAVDFELSSFHLETLSGRVALFDSAFAGADFLSQGAGAWLQLPRGRYRIGIAEWKPEPEAAFLLHHITTA